MQRRHFLKAATLGVSALTLPLPVFATKEVAPSTKLWREVEITNHLATNLEAGSEVWLPVPLNRTSYQELLATQWAGNHTRAGLLKEKPYDAGIFFAQWEKAGKLDLTVTHRVRLCDRSRPEPVSYEDISLYLKPTEHIPLDGIVRETALKVVKGARGSEQKVKKIYDWMAENTARDGKVRGCGVGDVKSLLTSGMLSGKCADLSSLFVGLCRASGVPAREVFGLRVLPSNISKSIGKEGDVSKGQHCRAEYFVENKGWIAADPADVRKVILEENLSPADTHVQDVRKKLLGAWEMNWVAFNSARDFSLGAGLPEHLNFLMYPTLIAGGKIINDGMEPDQFSYSIHAKEIV